MKPDENTQRIKPVEDHDESPNIEREHESEAAARQAERRIDKVDADCSDDDRHDQRRDE